MREQVTETDTEVRVRGMPNVREYAEGLLVELWRQKGTNRLVVRAYNEAGFNCTEIDLGDLLADLSHGLGARFDLTTHPE